ncbi:hypothetical protein AX774_g1675 [Zancudomyces culisetae]|uniref:Uncharacterized protein n=1 Tax=Zancudomyces culisetae TaxID=1213189 RepID=A0A1R1PUY8_ZANCU|nr:hypothetical protein AX774_g1675 [Zancudomyces culisetae]|eukprot:OMH84791.1 hypothetical protein AX774_g1675 [Zancudomyces culisetae]
MLPADSSEDAEQQQQRKLESKELVNKSMLALTMLVSIIDATPTMIFLEYFSMLKTFPDVPLILIEDILTKRDDMERSQIKSIMENLKAKTSAESNTAMARSAANANTVFSKLIHYNLA